MPSKNIIKTIFSLLEKKHHLTMLEELKDYTPFQKLVATLLSARTKDSTTIPIVKKLFQDCPTPEKILNLDLKVLEKRLYSIGFYKNKANHVQKLSKLVVEKYQGKVPENFDELVSLPGVGRKTANCLLNYAFHQPAIAVDTHVHRIANRLEWVKTTKPEETEFQLKKIIPKELWVKVNSLLVGHGQTICSPINPKCSICPILKYCPFGKQRMEKKS
ncbi:MAG TPA: endonuclease III [Candidatus Nanoarchaeia archaeon]|nr:endonuclease III [Candidatus Nanoarchaeia archaeon]